MLTDQGITEKQLKARAIESAKLRSELDAISALQDPIKIAQAALPYTESSNYLAVRAAFQLLADSGEAGLPYLRAILQDPEKHRLHRATVKALSAAGGPAVARELTTIVQDQLAYWKKTAPDLKQGWWNGQGLEWEEVRVLRNKYGFILEVFYTLRELKDPQCKEAVEAFRDYWRSQPVLEDPSGLTQMSEACDKVLEALQTKP